MKDTALVLLSAGSSSRFNLPTKKQWLYQGDTPLWLKVARDFSNSLDFKEVVVVGASDELNYMRLFEPKFKYVAGGSSRQGSLKNALEAIESKYILVNDIARCCLDRELLDRVIAKKGEADCIVPALRAIDTVYFKDEPINRQEVRLIQTPQLSLSKALREALSKKREFTDESSAIKANGGSILFVEGSTKAHKLTTVKDLNRLPCLKEPSNSYLVGYGVDTHAFLENKEMVLGGIKIEAPFGFKAHSDGDVLIHSLIDALLGASGMGDIGEHFPDTDIAYKGADSTKLLESVLKRVRGCGFELVNIDLTIIAETPRLKPYKEKIRFNLAKLLKLSPPRVNIKATTSEKLGFIGKKEGVTVHSVATLKYFNWKEAI